MAKTSRGNPEGIMDTVYLLGEAVGMDTNMGEVLEIGDEWWGILDGIYL